MTEWLWLAIEFDKVQWSCINFITFLQKLNKFASFNHNVTISNSKKLRVWACMNLVAYKYLQLYVTRPMQKVRNFDCLFHLRTAASGARYKRGMLNPAFLPALDLEIRLWISF